MTQEAISFPDRNALLSKIATNPEQHWDMVIVGGGIVGAGILHQAVQQGYKALLVEQKDFSWGTSSRSSKMVHGGLRYIAQGDLKLTKESLQAREKLLAQAPGLINRMGYYFIDRKWQFPGRFVMQSLLAVYDFLAGISDHKYYKANKVLDKFPSLSSNKLTGASYYTDSTVDDARLVIRVLQDAISLGGQAINYVKATKLLKCEHNSQVVGLTLQDISEQESTSGKQKSIYLKCSVVINATGAWADELRQEVVNEQRVRPLRGSHLVIPSIKLPVEDATILLHPEDKRPVYVFPWEGATVVGTTDLDHQKNLNHEASISPEEVDYLLLVLSKNFPSANIGREDIVSSFSGVRPVISSEKQYKQQSKKKAPSKERRDHAIWAEQGLVTASGGKLTTFRLTAIEAIRAAMPWLNSANEKHESIEAAFNHYKVELPKTNHNEAWLTRLTGRHGKNAYSILTQALNNKRTNDEQQLIAPTQFCLAECRWSLKHEGVVHLDDLLLRRTRLGLLLKNGAEELFSTLEIICQQELGWDKVKWQSELSRYQAIIRQHYALP